MIKKYSPQIQRLINIMKATTITRTDFHWQYPNKIPILMYDDNNKQHPTRLTDELILLHLKGDVILGLSPFVNSEYVLYGKIDLDAHASDEKEQIKEQGIVEEDLKRLCNELDILGYLYYVHSSGSSGKHLVVYDNKPCNAKKMRYFLKELQHKVLRVKDKDGNDTRESVERHEVFPKQNNLYETKFGNQAKAVLAVHPRTGNLAAVIHEGRLLSKTESINFLEQIMHKIPNAKPINFEVTPEIEEKYKQNKVEYTPEQITELNKKNIPEKCGFFENIACKIELPSGGVNRHEYLDGNLYQYAKDKPEVYKNYCNVQGRNHTAFNGAENWLFSCKTIHKYLNKNTGKIIDLAKIECKKCPHNPDNRLEVLENANKKDLQREVFEHLAMKQNSKATEKLTLFFQEVIPTHTTRDDTKTEIWVYKDGIYVPHGKTHVKQFCREVLSHLYNGKLVSEVILKIEADTFIDHDNFFIDENVDLLPVQNGILNVKTKELLEFSPDYRFFVKLPVIYKADAKCPNVIKHFEEVLPNKQDILTMQEVFGFCLYRDYKFEKAMMWLGTGRNGKGKSLELLKNLLGPENCSNISLQQLENDGFALSELFHKMANLCSDLSNTALKTTGNFKQLTGHDMVSAPRKFLPMIHFTNYAKMIFLANETPKPNDTSVAFWDRWVLLDFPYTFKPKSEFLKYSEEEIKNRKLKMGDENHIQNLLKDEELEGCLIWALEGLDRLFKNRGFSKTSTSEEVEKQWLRRSNSFEAFYLDCIEDDWEGNIIKDDLRKAYYNYCKINKLKHLGNKDINETLRTKDVSGDRIYINKTIEVEEKAPGIEVTNFQQKERVVVWKGIKFKPNYKKFLK